MELVKKNLVSIIFGVIAILAIVVDFYPMGGKREELKTEATAHAKKAEELQALLTKQRNLPIVKPGSTESEPLNGFPTKQAVEAAHQATDLVNKAADSLENKAANEINVHKPLVAGALPGSPGDTLPASSFAREYVGMFPPQIVPGAMNPNPGPVVPTTRRAGAPPSLSDILHAGVPPTPDELALARAEKQKQVETEVTRLGPNGPINPQEVTDAVAAAFKTLNAEMRTAIAKKCKVYVADGAFSMYPGMTVQAVPEPTHIFWAQIGLWVQEDICKAIAEMNDPFASVMDAPVKRLVKISFLNDNQPGQQQSQPGLVPVFVIPNLQPTQGVGNDTGMSMPTDASGGQAPPPPMDPNVDLTKNKNILLSPTGRQSNGVYDVVHFEVELEVDASKVPQVLEGLGSKRYITVIQLENIDSVDSALARAVGYYFGDKPVVHIKVKCEELFFRSWLQNYVPTRLKTQLGYPAPQPAATPAPA